ncbi:MAG: chorismate mutase [Rhodospirillales bacterium]|nr:chorismate mutase [Rhodospirillales bacterium]
MRVAVLALLALAAPAQAAEPAADTPAYWGTPSAAGGTCCRTLGEVRENIDRIDRAIVRLLAERGQYVHEAARFKKDPAGVEAPARAEAVVQRAMRLAAADGLPPAVAEATYRAMMRAFLDYERSVSAAAPR